MERYKEIFLKALQRNQVKEYLRGDGEYCEPPTQYEDNPAPNTTARIYAIHKAYSESNDTIIAKKFEEVLLELSNSTLSDLCWGLVYLSEQLRMESKQNAKFELSNEYYKEIKNIVAIRENEIKSSEKYNFLWNTVERNERKMAAANGHHII